ncbi:MAG TPA: PAS domain-containing sensor histidine kinase [Gemmatimonadales bacterium]|nr:PAS domain-containing sensor histidine kinase [Gemmatimonadales bacterium]
MSSQEGHGAGRSLEQQLRETEMRFRIMADVAPVLLWMSREDGLCTFFNQTWLDFTGRTLDDEWGVGWAEGVHFEDLQRCMDTYSDAFNAREMFEMEYRLRRRDGVYRWVLDRGTPRYTPDGTFTGYIGSCIDITDRKQLEAELRQAVRVRDDFLSIASHELRTPLTALKLRAEIMRRTVQQASLDGSVGARLKAEAAATVNHVQRLVTMVDVLLDASRLAEGPLALDREEVEVGTLVASVADRMRESAATAGSALRVEVGAPISGRWDRFRIEQVVGNLIGNAIKYGAGRPIEVSAGPSAGKAVIAVNDQGVGISPEDQRRLFERFARLTPGRYYGGFGLGLWISRTIVEAHGGTIAVSSQLGNGASFVVQLPLR